jgi:hypothetical protein
MKGGIMKLVFSSITSLLVFTLQAQSIETVLPINSVDFSDRITGGEDIELNTLYLYDFIYIYGVAINDDRVDCMVGGSWVAGMLVNSESTYGFSHCVIFQTSRTTNTVTLNYSKSDAPRISNIENTDDSAIIDDNAILLDNSSGGSPQVTYDTCFDYEIKQLAAQDINGENKLIGGLIEWSTNTCDGHNGHYSYTADFWSPDGKHIWGMNIERDKYFWGLPDVTKLRFIKNGEFLTFNLSVPGNGIIGERYISTSYSYLIDVETFTFLPANRDVTFTSDEKYYVTERDGLPSLVDVETHDVLLRYDPGSTMTACGFSPDDARLYIACEDLKVYEFSSHVPDTAVENWAVFE